MRVATYNIHKGVLNDLFGLRRVSVIHDLRDRLHELDADLVFLQEVQGHHARNASRFAHWPSEPQHQFLARSAGMRHVFESAYGNNANYLHGHHGNALLSRFPIVHRENRDISDHALEKRGVLHCVVTINRRAVHCFVVHFGLFARSRQRQLDVLIRWIRDEVARDAPVIVAGDFNDW
ncbi:MAG: endonuclease/exonuclease/phosphatase family protein, partial [Candidatus Accumulibacter sp.]|nr:endonuclease/exonuclease/phosphatase family protein [Accumulibacter sp.]